MKTKSFLEKTKETKWTKIVFVKYCTVGFSFFSKVSCSKKIIILCCAGHHFEPIQSSIMAMTTKSRSSDLDLIFFSLKKSQPAMNPTTTPERLTREMTEIRASG